MSSSESQMSSSGSTTSMSSSKTLISNINQKINTNLFTKNIRGFRELISNTQFINDYDNILLDLNVIFNTSYKIIGDFDSLVIHILDLIKNKGYDRNTLLYITDKQIENNREFRDNIGEIEQGMLSIDNEKEETINQIAKSTQYDYFDTKNQLLLNQQKVYSDSSSITMDFKEIDNKLSEIEQLLLNNYSYRTIFLIKNEQNQSDKNSQLLEKFEKLKNSIKNNVMELFKMTNKSTSIIDKVKQNIIIPTFINDNIIISNQSINRINEINNVYKKDTLIFCTSNYKKFIETINIFGIELYIEQSQLKVTEIQGSAEEIIRDKVLKVYDQIKQPIICEITCLCIKSLKGQPGPQIKDWLKWLTPKMIQEIVKRFDEKSATAISIFAQQNGKPNSLKTFEGVCNGEIVAPIGTRDFGFGCIFKPKSLNKTQGQMNTYEKQKCCHRTKSIEKLQKYLMPKNQSRIIKYKN